MMDLAPAQIDAEDASFLKVTTALTWAAGLLEQAGIENARFEAQLLMALALDVSRIAILAGLRPQCSEPEFRAFERLVHERERRVPLAYLRGNQEFYGLSFLVTPATLIPRPETELLVEFALEKFAESEAPLLVDIGTGTGCIPIAALAHYPQARAIACDLSAEALEVARRNAAANRVSERLRLLQANLLSGVLGRADILVSNPPYIPAEEIAGLQPEVRDFEPRLALDGGADGLALLSGIVQEAHRVLKPKGWLAVEVAQGQAPAVADLFAEQGLTDIAIRRDLAGIERNVTGRTV